MTHYFGSNVRHCNRVRVELIFVRAAESTADRALRPVARNVAYHFAASGGWPAARHALGIWKAWAQCYEGILLMAPQAILII